MPAQTSPIPVVHLTQSHKEDWAKLYAAYAAFYGVAQTPEMRERVWGWLQDPEHELEGLVALGRDERPVGLAHFRPYTRPLAASTGGFLDDLFIDPGARGSGAAQALLGSVAGIGRSRGWSLIRWITKEDNYRARAAYDRVAVKTDWVTYDLAL